MSSFKHISPQETWEHVQNKTAVVADIRDPNTFMAGHIEGAFHLNNETLSEFLAQTDKATPVIVNCYHGISSQQAAEFLAQQGFEDVYSMDGGFEAWRGFYPFSSGEES